MIAFFESLPQRTKMHIILTTVTGFAIMVLCITMAGAFLIIGNWEAAVAGVQLGGITFLFMLALAAGLFFFDPTDGYFARSERREINDE